MLNKRCSGGLILVLFLLVLSVNSFAETTGEKMALEEAKTILAAMPLSYKGLTDQLCLGGYAPEEAEYAAEHCKIDWNQQAIRALKRYRDVSEMADEEIRRQMADDGFTEEQIAAAFMPREKPMDGEADRLARQYLNLGPYSPDGLVDQLRREGISEEEARGAVNGLDVDWADEAARSAERHEKEGVEIGRMQDVLKGEGFTPEQAREGMNRRHR